MGNSSELKSLGPSSELTLPEHPCQPAGWASFLSIILRRLFALENQRRQDKKKRKEKESRFATNFENDVAAVQHQNGDQEVSY